MQSFMVSKYNLVKRLRIGGKSERDTSHDNKIKQLHKLPRQIHGVVASYLEYKEIIVASSVCRGGGFFQGTKPNDFISPLRFKDIPSDSARNEEWISFLFRELKDQGYYFSLERDLRRESYWKARLRKEKTDPMLAGTSGVLMAIAFLSFYGGLPLGFIMDSGWIFCTSFLTSLFGVLGFLNVEEYRCASVDSAESPTSLIVKNRLNILNNFYNKFRQILFEKGINLPAKENYLCSYKTMKFLFILLSNQDLKQLKFEIDDRTKQELIYYCIKFCDVEVGTGHLINRFMQLINQMQLDLNKDFRRNELMPVDDFQSAITQYFPTDTELQKFLLHEFRNFLLTMCKLMKQQCRY